MCRSLCAFIQDFFRNSQCLPLWERWPSFARSEEVRTFALQKCIAVRQLSLFSFGKSENAEHFLIRLFYLYPMTDSI